MDMLIDVSANGYYVAVYKKKEKCIPESEEASTA